MSGCTFKYTKLVLDLKKREDTREEVATLPFLGFFSLGLVFLGFFDLEFIFRVELEDPAARGYLVEVELSFERD